MCKFVILLVISITVTSCATTPGSSSLTGDKSMQGRLGNAFLSPLSDFNLLPITIPPVVSEAVKNPYRIPEDNSCKALAEQVHQLDIALGSDVDAIAAMQEKTAAEKGNEFIQDEAIGTVERTISGAIPFRGWIRKLTGAERRSKEINAAISAGIVRRAFLKGIGQEEGCEYPAAPLKHPPAVIPAPATEAMSVVVAPPASDIQPQITVSTTVASELVQSTAKTPMLSTELGPAFMEPISGKVISAQEH